MSKQSRSAATPAEHMPRRNGIGVENAERRTGACGSQIELRLRRNRSTQQCRVTGQKHLMKQRSSLSLRTEVLTIWPDRGYQFPYPSPPPSTPQASSDEMKRSRSAMTRRSSGAWNAPRQSDIAIIFPADSAQHEDIRITKDAASRFRRKAHRTSPVSDRKTDARRRAGHRFFG